LRAPTSVALPNPHIPPRTFAPVEDGTGAFGFEIGNGGQCKLERTLAIRAAVPFIFSAHDSIGTRGVRPHAYCCDIGWPLDFIKNEPAFSPRREIDKRQQPNDLSLLVNGQKRALNALVPIKVCRSPGAAVGAVVSPGVLQFLCSGAAPSRRKDRPTSESGKAKKTEDQ